MNREDIEAALTSGDADGTEAAVETFTANSAKPDKAWLESVARRLAVSDTAKIRSAAIQCFGRLSQSGHRLSASSRRAVMEARYDTDVAVRDEAEKVRKLWNSGPFLPRVLSKAALLTRLLPTALVQGVNWMRAWENYDKRNFSKTLEYLATIALRTSLKVEISLLEARCRYHLGEFEKCISLCEDVRAYAHAVTRYSSCEVAYLKAFSRILQARAEAAKAGNMYSPETMREECSDVPLPLVSAELKRKFPLVDHPRWTHRRSLRI